LYKTDIKTAKLKNCKETFKTGLTVRSPLRRGRSVLECSATEEEVEEEEEEDVQLG
jgi:hypothetical protein